MSLGACQKWINSLSHSLELIRNMIQPENQIVSMSIHYPSCSPVPELQWLSVLATPIQKNQDKILTETELSFLPVKLVPTCLQCIINRKL